MDSYNHHMMDSNYGNIVYGGNGQIHPQNLPPQNLIMQQQQHQPPPPHHPQEPHKDNVQYVTSRESIITSNMTVAGQHLDVYQQQQQHPQHLQIDNGGIHQYINHPQKELEQQQISPQQEQQQPSPQEQPPPQQIQPDEQPQTEPIIPENIEVPAVNDEVYEEAAQQSKPEVDIKVENEASIEAEPELSITHTTSLEIESLEATEGAVAETLPKPKTENEVDQNQCRICLSKINLVNIFTYEDKARICDVIMSICTTVKIIEKDYLPHYICTVCLENMKVAINFKTTCEQTDTELRKKLKRSKNKIRSGPSKYMLVDCELSSGTDDNKDDDEFQISDAVESDASDASFKIGKRKRPSRSKRKSPKKKDSRTRSKPSAPAKPTPKAAPSRSTRTSNRASTVASSKAQQRPPPTTLRHDVVFIEAPQITDEESEVEEPPTRSRRSKPSSSKSRTPAAKSPAATTTPTSSNKSSKIPHKKRGLNITADSAEDSDSKTTKQPTKPREIPCHFCDQVFPSNNALKEHRKVHVGEKPLSCNICSKAFRQRVSLDAHIQKHKEDDSRKCKPCDKQFANKSDLRKHQQTVHEDEYTFECEKCKRSFTSKARLDKHKDGKCPGFDTTQRKKTEVEVNAHLGRDLFKCVAPLTSTYWSDDYSE